VWALHYTKSLEVSGRFHLIIWPEHCIIGTSGHCLVDDVSKAIHEWEMATGKTAEFVMKGLQNLTEMYSVLQAEVPVCDASMFNQELFDSLVSGDELWIAGQAASHCVNYTTRQEHLLLCK